MNDNYQLTNNVLATLNKPHTITQLLAKLDRTPLSDLQFVIQRLVKRRVINQLPNGAYVSVKSIHPLYSLESCKDQFFKISKNLPIPHEIHSDWRFSFDATCDIVKLVSNLIFRNAKVGCIGTPSVALLLALSDYPLDICLIDKNELVCTRIKEGLQGDTKVNYIASDLYQVADNSLFEFDFIFTDPPWIEPHHSKFLDFGTQCLGLNGVFVLITFPEYHSEFSQTKRKKTFDIIYKNGLTPTTILPDRVKYIAKPTVAKIIPSNDRLTTIDCLMGDLIIAQKLSIKKVEIEDLIIEQNWRIFHNAKCLIAVNNNREDNNHYRPPKLIPCSNIDYNKSILSRNDPRVKHVDVWTSGNQAFFVENITIFQLLLQLIINGNELDQCALIISNQYNIAFDQVKEDIDDCYYNVIGMLELENSIL